MADVQPLVCRPDLQAPCHWAEAQSQGGLPAVMLPSQPAGFPWARISTGRPFRSAPSPPRLPAAQQQADDGEGEAVAGRGEGQVGAGLGVGEALNVCGVHGVADAAADGGGSRVCRGE